MNRTVDIVVANPSGNITILVLTLTPRSQYKDIAQQLLDMKHLGGEQVAFELPDASDVAAALPRMEMCGLEFCGNASRAFALYKSLCKNPPLSEITVNVSGCSESLTARITPEAPNAPKPPKTQNAADADGAASASSQRTGALSNHTQNAETASHPRAGIVAMEMPVPAALQTFTAEELPVKKSGALVSIDGISHLILEDIPPTSAAFDALKDHIYQHVDPQLPAFGVMFCDTVNQLMTPVVYVKDVDTTYFEGSCASGTVAASFALARSLPDGEHRFTMEQPGGVLHTIVTKKENRVGSISLSGLITLSDTISVELP